MKLLCLARKSSTEIAMTQALLRRGIINVEEQSKLRDRLWRMMSGYGGELRADRFWEEIQLEGKHLLFHSFETVNHIGYTHQMDTVFICPRFVLIVELKNIAGEITYDKTHNQLLRLSNGDIKALGDPFHQVTRHASWFEHFLWEIGVHSLPVLSAVVVTTTSSILKNMPERFHVFKLEGLRFKLLDWYNHYQVQVEDTILLHIRDELLKRYQTRKVKLPYDQVQLRKGIICECGLKMTYEYGVFKCQCGIRCRDGFQRGLAEYRLLVDEWITNRQFRDFFEISDVHVASKILSRLKLKSTGKRKGTKYFIPESYIECVSNKVE